MSRLLSWKKTRPFYISVVTLVGSSCPALFLFSWQKHPDFFFWETPLSYLLLTCSCVVQVGLTSLPSFRKAQDISLNNWNIPFPCPWRSV